MGSLSAAQIHLLLVYIYFKILLLIIDKYQHMHFFTFNTVLV